LSSQAKIDNSSIQRVEEFKYLGTTLTDQNSIQEEIKSRLKLGKTCYHSVQNVLSSSLLSKNLKIKIQYIIVGEYMFRPLRCPYTYESGSRVSLGSGSNESNSSMCGVSRLMRVWRNISEPGYRVKLPEVV
jgi:hypothetical protein